MIGARNYVIKLGAKYATGSRTWTTLQRKAFRFDEAWARLHAGTFGGRVRIVRLKKRGGK